MLHEGFRCYSAAPHAEGNNAACAIGHVFLCTVIILVAGQAGIVDPCDLIVALKELCNGQRVFAVAGHAHMQAFEAEVEQKRALRAGSAAKIAHELRGGLGDERAFLAELLGIGDAVIAVVGGAQAGELVGILGPVKFAAIHDTAANGGAVAVQILGGRVDYSGRSVIRPDPTLRADEISVCYLSFLEVYKYEIRLLLSKLNNISMSKADDIINYAKLEFDPSVYAVMNYIISTGHNLADLNRK